MTTLKNVMLINAVSSGATALLLIFLPDYIAGIFGTSQTWPFVATGIFLLLFAGLVYFASRQSPVRKGLLQFIIFLDVMWVLDSLVIVVPQLFSLTFIGYFLITAVALWVAAMAYFQFMGLRKLSLINS